MDRSRPDQILDAWASVAATAVRPSTAPRRTVVRSSLPGLSLAGAGLLVAAVLVAVVWIGRPGSNDGVGGLPSLDPSPSATAEPTPSATEEPERVAGADPERDSQRDARPDPSPRDRPSALAPLRISAPRSRPGKARPAAGSRRS